MSDESMLRRIDRMERRLERIEALLHMPAEPAATERNVKLMSDTEDKLPPIVADRDRISHADGAFE